MWPLLPAGCWFPVHFSKEAAQTQCEPRTGLDSGHKDCRQGFWTMFVKEELSVSKGERHPQKHFLMESPQI